MDAVLEFIYELPVLALGVSGGVVGLLIAAGIVTVIRRLVFIRRVHAFVAIPGDQRVEDFFAPKQLLRRSRTLEKIAKKHDLRLITNLGLDRLWSERLAAKERPADFRRVLAYATEKGLFACFLSALKNKRLSRALHEYLDEHDDFLVLRKLALSGRGEEFDGAVARDFFSNRIDEIREMTGDPEWPARYFAVKILVHDEDERSERALWDTLADPHALVRRTVAAELRASDRIKLYDRLIDLFLHDPVFEVRKAARDRISADLKDLYTLNAKDLQPEEVIHVVELLDPTNDDDENAALELLAGDDLELRLAAARFLVKSGRLESLFLSVDFADLDALNRVRSLLTNAVEVNVVDFLSALQRQTETAPLLVAAEILSHHGPAELISELAERVFRLQDGVTQSYIELYTATAQCVGARGPDAAHLLLANEIKRRKALPDLLRAVLDAIPSGRDHVYRAPLLDALHDPDFPERDRLTAAVMQLSPAIVLNDSLRIVTSGRENYPHRVRIDALSLLGELRLPYALQDILEHLPTLPTEAAREFAKILQEYSPKELERKIRALLDSVDGNIRAAVISILPGTGKKTFLPDVRKALSDAAPEVRVSAAWALVDFEESRALNQAVDLLRDPVEHVRIEVARALAVGGGKPAYDALARTLADENEVDTVKHSAIAGLGDSGTPEAVDVLIPVFEHSRDLVTKVQAALAARPTSAAIARLVGAFKDGEPDLRDSIARVFTLMGEKGEDAIRELLDQDIASLRPYLAEILDTTGYVESRIRLLNNRNPRVRREAAELLSHVANNAAYRGIVLAARDPDSEVRVKVTRALEKLATEEGKELLTALENDPDRKVRKYTHWALERLRAKEL